MFKYNFKNIIALGKQDLFSITSAVVPKNRFVVVEPVMANPLSTWLDDGIQIFGQTQLWKLM